MLKGLIILALADSTGAAAVDAWVFAGAWVAAWVAGAVVAASAAGGLDFGGRQGFGHGRGRGHGHSGHSGFGVLSG